MLSSETYTEEGFQVHITSVDFYVSQGAKGLAIPTSYYADLLKLFTFCYNQQTAQCSVGDLLLAVTPNTVELSLDDREIHMTRAQLTILKCSLSDSRVFPYTID